MTNCNSKIQAYDDRRDIVVPGDHQQTFEYCVEHFIATANKAIADHGYFAVALSGGSTPKGIFSLLASSENRHRVKWDRLRLFWSDERAVPPDHPDSNYRMAMEAGFGLLSIPENNIFRMVAETDIEASALDYEKIIFEQLKSGSFDLVMLGMGDDGHTASLFPRTHALHSQNRFVTANYVPQQHSWRMSLTFECINASKVIAIYVMGQGKSKTLRKVLSSPYDLDEFPIQGVGTPEHHALWIVDQEAAAGLL